MNKIASFFDRTFLDLGRQFKWTYLPPLMVYMAAGISGLTGIVGTFFVKDYLNLELTGSSFLKECNKPDLEFYQISKDVNKPTNNSISLIQKV